MSTEKSNYSQQRDWDYLVPNKKGDSIADIKRQTSIMQSHLFSSAISMRVP